MSASKLAKPSIEYKESFLEALKEFQARGERKYLSHTDLSQNFEGFIDDLVHNRSAEPYPEWVEPVPETVLWLVKDDQYLGSIEMRHRLNWHLDKWGGHVHFTIRPSMRGHGFGSKILRKALSCMAALGIEKALITVDPDNIIAQHIVEKLGAEFEDQTEATKEFPARKRYWLDCG